MSEKSNLSPEQIALSGSRSRVERTGEIMAKREKRFYGRDYAPVHLVHERANNEAIIEKLSPYSGLEVAHRDTDTARQVVVTGDFKGIKIKVVETVYKPDFYRYKYEAKIGAKNCDPKISEKIFKALSKKINDLRSAKEHIKEAEALDDEPDPSPSYAIEDILSAE